MGTTLAAPYVILFMGYLEDKTWNSFVEKPLDWWRYIYDIFMIWQHGKEKPKVIFLDVEVIYLITRKKSKK